MTVCCIAMMPAFLGMFTSSKTVIELGVRYSVVAFAFTLIIIVGVTFEKIFQAVGNMKTTMISLASGMRFGSRKRLQQSFLFVFTTRQ